MYHLSPCDEEANPLPWEEGTPARLIILDNSVQDETGHHLEYARRIAVSVGMEAREVVLLAHNACPPSVEGRMRVVPTFSQTFWEQYGYSRKGLISWLRRWLRKQRDRILRSRDRFVQRRLALFMARLRSVSDPRDPIVGAFASRVRPNATPALWLLAAHLVRGVRRRLLSATARSVDLAKRVLRQLRLTGLVRSFLKVFRFIGLALVALAAAPFALVALLLLFAFRMATRKPGLARELKSAMRRLSVRSDDVLFVPTAGGAELGAVLTWLEGARGKRVRVLFRREVWRRGELPKFALDAPQIREVKNLLAQLAKVSGHDIRVLVDTEALAEQYRALSTLPVEVLPIPSLPRGVAQARAQRPSGGVRVVCLGDARGEKGFHLLPDIAHAALADPQLDVTFWLQANVHPDNREPQVFASLAKLESEAFGRLNLLREPLDPETYASMLGRADVLLVPYSPDAYSARSSGVFAEAIAAATPVVTTIGSWMDRVVACYVGAEAAAAFASSEERAASLPGSGAMQVVRFTPDLPLPRERLESALFDMVLALRRALASGAPERPGGAAVLVGMHDGAAYVAAQAEFAEESGFGYATARAAEALQTRHQTRWIDSRAWPMDLCAGVRVASPTAEAMGAALHALLRDMPAARRDAARARARLLWLYDEERISRVLLHERVHLQGRSR